MTSAVVIRGGLESKSVFCSCCKMFEYGEFDGEEGSDYYEHDMHTDEPPWGLDPFSADDHDVSINIEDFKESVWQRIFQHYVCALSSSATPANALLTEAELHMQAYDYRQALICALAASSADDSESVQLRTSMIQTICLYQLGDRTAACELKDNIGDYDQECVSDYLLKRYRGTCEVLGFMPDLLGMLQGMRKKQDEEY